MIVVYRYRVKNLSGLLNWQARSVNYVWNYCNESQKSAIRLGQKWLSGFDLSYLTAGASKELGLHSQTVQAICAQYANSREQKKRQFLRWRGKKSLGWVPFSGQAIKRVGENFRFAGRAFRVFYSRPIPACAEICNGSNFSQDSQGNWFINIVLKIPEEPRNMTGKAVGIDLGLKTLATFSTGEKVAHPRHLGQLTDKLVKAQRAHKKRQVTNIHAHIANARRDFHHKLSTRIVKDFDYIAVGNVNAAGLAKTRMAKSVQDAGWSSFRNMLRYKAIGHGAIFEEVNEAYSTQACSHCGALCDERPRGIADLGIRTWCCSICGSVHDRDVNAALNILSGSGHRSLAEGIPAL